MYTGKGCIKKFCESLRENTIETEKMKLSTI